MKIANATTIIKELSNSNQIQIKFNLREIGMKIYFLIKLTFAYYESDV